MVLRRLLFALSDQMEGYVGIGRDGKAEIAGDVRACVQIWFPGVRAIAAGLDPLMQVWAGDHASTLRGLYESKFTLTIVWVRCYTPWMSRARHLTRLNCIRCADYIVGGGLPLEVAMDRFMDRLNSTADLGKRRRAPTNHESFGHLFLTAPSRPTI
jgi:hypothetical protein